MNEIVRLIVHFTVHIYYDFITTLSRATILSPTEKLSFSRARCLSVVRRCLDESAFKKSGPLTRMPSHSPPVELVVIVGARNHAMITHTRDSHLIDPFRGIYRAEYIKGLSICPRLIRDDDDDDRIAPRRVFHVTSCPKSC